MKPALTVQPFGRLPDGRSVELWRLQGAGGVIVEAMTYGGIVTRLLVPDLAGHVDDVVLGFNRLEDYLAGHPYFGAIVGRVAGRLTNARFQVEGKTYLLAANDPPHHLHGGVQGFDKRLWTATPAARSDGAPSLRLTYRSPEGEEGYPGTVDVAVTYTVTADNAFMIQSEAVTDRPTPLSLTHHSYFNLAGEGSGPATGHELQIFADVSVPTDERFGHLEGEVSVRGEPNDFNQARRLVDAIPGLFKNHGSLYRIRRETHRLAPAARLADGGSGRVLDVSTTETHIQLYTGMGLDGSLAGKSGVRYVRYAGVCLECEGHPDRGIVLHPGGSSRHTTVYAFSNHA